jgi:hypothetical protein
MKITGVMKMIFEPKIIISRQKPNNAFPAKKSVKTMTFSIENCPP